MPFDFDFVEWWNFTVCIFHISIWMPDRKAARRSEIVCCDCNSLDMIFSIERSSGNQQFIVIVIGQYS